MATTIANGLKGKRGRPFKIKDFLPTFGRGVRKSVAQLEASLNHWLQAHQAMQRKRRM